MLEVECSAQKALNLALAAKDEKFAQEIKKWLDIYKRMNISPRENNNESN